MASRLNSMIRGALRFPRRSGGGLGSSNTEGANPGNNNSEDETAYTSCGASSEKVHFTRNSRALSQCPLTFSQHQDDHSFSLRSVQNPFHTRQVAEATRQWDSIPGSKLQPRSLMLFLSCYLIAVSQKLKDHSFKSNDSDVNTSAPPLAVGTVKSPANNHELNYDIDTKAFTHANIDSSNSINQCAAQQDSTSNVSTSIISDTVSERSESASCFVSPTSSISSVGSYSFDSDLERNWNLNICQESQQVSDSELVHGTNGFVPSTQSNCKSATMAAVEQVQDSTEQEVCGYVVPKHFPSPCDT